MPKSNAHLLLVEDDEIDAYLLQRLLMRQKFHWPVTVFHDAHQALSYVAGKLLDPDVQYIVVLDLLLPGMHGFEFLRKLGELPGGKAMPVIILTGSEYPHNLDQAKHYQVAAYLHKSESEAVLEQVITQVITQSLTP
jgi:CheY-like chemotaxis protein